MGCKKKRKSILPSRIRFFFIYSCFFEGYTLYLTVGWFTWLCLLIFFSCIMWQMGGSLLWWSETVRVVCRHLLSGVASDLSIQKLVPLAEAASSYVRQVWQLCVDCNRNNSRIFMLPFVLRLITYKTHLRSLWPTTWTVFIFKSYSSICLSSDKANPST